MTTLKNTSGNDRIEILSELHVLKRQDELLKKQNAGQPIRDCNICGCSLEFSPTYDSHFCPECNVWHYGGCLDPDCEFCSTRPDRPLEVSAAKISAKGTRS